MLLTIMPLSAGQAQQPETGDLEVVEIVVNFEVRKLINRDIFAQYDGFDIYLPLIDIFKQLELYIDTDFRSQRFSGFIISKKNKFEIDLTRQKALAMGKTHKLLSSDYFLMPHELYLRIDLFKQLFDLEMEFIFSTLQVKLPLNEDFPYYQRLKRRQAHVKLETKKEALKDVNRLPRKREYFGSGALDWTISASPYRGGTPYANLILGGMLLGGDLSIAGGGNTITGFDKNEFIYKWHYCFDNNRFLTQAELGHIYTGSLLSRRLLGGLVTNKPQVQRKHFQTVNLSGAPGAGWEVELYINNQLTDVVYTDNTGEYDFQVDIVYGITEVILKMYGPNGEITTERKYIGVPYNLIPKASYEYSAAFGEAQEVDNNGKYIQASGAYGYSNRLTFGLSSELPLSPQPGEKSTFSGDATYQVMENLTTNVSFAPGYTLSIAQNFSHPTMMNLNFSYSKFFENQFRNRLNQIHDFKLSASSPLRIGRHHYGLKYSISWSKFPGINNINMNYGFNTSLGGFYLNYLGRYKISKHSEQSVKNVSSKLFLSPQFFRWLRPQFKISYDHTLNQVTQYGLNLNKRLFKTGQLSLSFERHEITKSYQVAIALKFWSNFADFTSRLIHSDGYTSLSQIQSGSIRFDQDARRLFFDRRNSVGYGTAVIRPFMDNNYNGVLNEGEEYIPGLKASIKGGRQKRFSKDQYYYGGLRPYNPYIVRIDKTSLNNPMLRPTHENYEVFCNPNTVTTINVPLVTSSDISGQVSRQVGDMKTGQGGIKLVIINITNESVTEITTFSNGQFYYLGLLPGSYRIYIDSEQLDKYGYRSEPHGIEFEVEPVKGGTSIEDINLLLIPKE
ncbi:MAG: hypothetical protein GY839_12735 [candidate division Zixibacteria bacterium]|nr:hypothetical protein [candidate division Zixibacteria bacterium]